MKQCVYLLVFCFSVFSYSQSSQELFNEANSLYKNGEYEKAIASYQKIEGNNEVSSALFYNLGNCYYKLNKVAPTIFYYEKALLLDPLNEDAQNNLVFAKRLTLDRIEALPKSVFQKIDENYFQKLSYNNWAIVSIILSFIASILFLVFYNSYTSKKKRIYFVTSVISFLLLIVSIVITYQQFNNATTTKFAIIFTQEIEVKNAPTENSEDIFTLHEGTKVKVIDSVDSWKKIKLADGKVGWLSAKDVKLLNSF